MSDLIANDKFVEVNGSLYNRRLTEQFVKDIQIAHAINPESWCIRPANGAPYLAVGFLNALSIQGPSDAYSFLISTEGIDERTLVQAQPYFDDKRTYVDRPWAQNLRFSDEAVARFSDLFSEAHEAAIRRMAREVGSRANQWKRHADRFRTSLNDALGIDIPEPGYLHEIPILKDSVQLHNGFPLSSLDARLLQLIADDITLAHSINPKSWALYLAQGGVLTLAVGNLAVFWLVENDNGFWLKGNLDDSRFDALREEQVKTLRFDASGGFKASGMTPSECIDRFQEFSSEHASSVSDLANGVRTHTHYHKFHQPHSVDELAEVLDVELPTPTYPLATNEASVVGRTVTGPRYWKISPGSNAAFWDEFQALSAIAVHWVAGLADLRDLPESKDDFLKAVAAFPDATSHAARALWGFREEIKPGDGILAYGNRTVLGFGTVTGDYRAVHDDFHYNHRRSVEWQSVEPRTVGGLPDPLQRRLARNSTIVELTNREFFEATGQASLSKAGIDPLATVRDQFAASGLHYTDAQIATFYTALQTKGFVVLSGISGTGKSKIATGFVKMLPDGLSTIEESVADVSGMISITVKPYMQKHKRIFIPAKQQELLSSVAPGERLKIPFTMHGVEAEGTLARVQTDASSSMYLNLRGDVANAFLRLEIGSRLFLRPTLNEDNDSVTSIALVQPELFSDTSLAERERVSNHLFLSVRPDWRDSTSLLGYYNPLTQTYEWTDFLRFLIRARENFDGPPEDRIAWFVILDEMNLAHVEYYFADLLSVIESGRDSEGWTREPLRMTYPDTLEDEAPPRELYLPPNLYLIGTVNMDETTHAFSPKVLDRAFTIELADVDFTNYPISGTGAGAGELTDDEKSALLRAFTRSDPETGKTRFALIDKGEIGTVVLKYGRIRDDLQALNGLLQQNRMHFGYRVFDEICQYLHNNDVSGMMPFEDAFDQAVFMKVLPKFTGSKARLQSPLRKMLAWAIDPGATTSADIDAVVQQFAAYEMGTDEASWNWPLNAAFPLVATRVRDMLVALERDGFVSFG